MSSRQSVLQRAWSWLTTEGPSQERDPAVQRRSRLLLSAIVLLLALAVVGLFIVIGQLVFVRDASESHDLTFTYPLIEGVCIAVLLVAYILARRGWHRVPVIMICVLNLAGSSSAAIFTHDGQDLVYMAISVSLAGVILSWRWTLGIFGIAAASVAAVSALLPGVHPLATTSAILLILMLGTIGVATAIIRDRDLKQIEEQNRKLKENQESLLAAHKMEAIARLSSGIAHEFNNIMTAIVGYSDIIIRKPVDSAPRYAWLIRDAGLRAGDLTERLLSFSGQQLLRPVSTDLNLLMTQLRRGTAVALDLSHEDATAMIDPDQVSKAIETLLEKAAGNTRAGAPVLVRTRRVSVVGSEEATLPPGPYFLISISDGGPPLSKDIVSKIFDPFFTTGELGTGDLDLAAAYGIIAQSGGHVSAQSDPQEGNVFLVHLPLASAG
ncbi:MAG TPA: ATP-binding protein [Spirochaetia bacterium]|nr:ATP-binding protein [Spirochaetia bacterium]